MRTIGLIDISITTTNEPENTATDYTELKKSELIALCEEKGIELTAADKRSKDSLIEALEK